MALIEVDDRHWPAFIVRPPDAVVSDEDLDTFLRENAAYLRMRNERFAYVLDLKNSAGLTPTQRQRMTQAFDETEKSMPGLCQGTALVFTSNLLKGLLTAILWVRKPRYETKVFTDVDEAVAWARQMSAAPAPVLASASEPPASISGEQVRDEATRIQRAVMLDDTRSLEPASAEAVTTLMMRIARHDWKDASLLDMRQQVEAFWVGARADTSCSLEGSKTLLTLQQCEVLSVLAKHLKRAA